MGSAVRTPLLPALLVASLAAGSGLLSAACGPEAPEPRHPPSPPATSAAAPAPAGPPERRVALQATGITPAWLDRSASACQDFYQLTCGGLIKNVEIPADKSAWGPAQELQLHTEELLRRMLDRAVLQPGDDPVQRKLGAWFGACMDEGAVEKAGVAALKPLFAAIDRVKERRSLHEAITELHRHAVFPIFNVSSQQDFKDATLVIAAVDQDGLGLPDRDYYLDDDAKTKDVRAYYRGHVERMFALAGDKAPAAKKAADDVLRIETALAKLAQDKVIRRDPYKIYNKIDRKGLADAAKSFPWDAYFTALGFPGIKDVTVNSVSYLAGVDALLGNEKPAARRSYLRWTVLAAEGNRLGKAIVDERFALRQKLTGQKELEPRWKRCVESTDHALGELLAQAYVKEKFDATSKRSAEGLLQSIRGAMKAELGALPWMDPATRAAAQDKLSRMNDKIGYPAQWKSYDFDVRPAAFAENSIASDTFELARTLRKVGKPLDRNEWQMTPPTVNAYYDPSLNEMVFPAGILQPPFFDTAFSAAVNYGATGAVMGHELTHGFDDEGSQFDGAGNLRNWWSEQTGKLFKEQTGCVVQQYAGYEAVPGLKLNGELTAGENIADIGGLKLALTAFREARKAEAERLVADGYSEEQVLFLAYGQSWCQKERPEYLELVAKTNPHSPPRFRVNGVIADVPQFAEAFGCAEGSPMRPAKVCAVWGGRVRSERSGRRERLAARGRERAAARRRPVGVGQCDEGAPRRRRGRDRVRVADRAPHDGGEELERVAPGGDRGGVGHELLHRPRERLAAERVVAVEDAAPAPPPRVGGEHRQEEVEPIEPVHDRVDDLEEDGIAPRRVAREERLQPRRDEEEAAMEEIGEERAHHADALVRRSNQLELTVVHVPSRERGGAQGGR